MAAQLHAAWQAGTGRPFPDWAPEELADVADLVLPLIPAVTAAARWRLGLPAVVEGEHYPRALNVHTLAWRLLTMARYLGLRTTDIPLWVEVLATGPDVQAVGPSWDLGFFHADADAWVATGLPGGLMPLAHAAGLSPAEAVERHAAGTLDAEGLRMLAGLRGRLMPTTFPTAV